MKPPSDRRSAWSELEQQMLDAARQERIPPELRARMHNRVHAARAGVAAHPSARAPGARLLFSKAGTWGSLAVIALGGAALWSTLHFRDAQRTPLEHAAVSGEPTSASANAAPSEVARSTAYDSSSGDRVMAGEGVSRGGPPLTAAARVGVGPSMPDARASIQEELSLLDRARVAVRSRDGAGALGLLDEHSQRFSHGVFQPEAQVLRIEALAASGERQRAQALGRSFLQHYSGHPLAEHVSKLIARR